MRNLINSLFDFTGCTTRKNYWIFMLCCVVFFFLTGVTFGILDIDPDTFGWSLTFIVASFVLFPAIIIRRLRDAGYKPWWILVLFIPIPMVSYIALIVLGFLTKAPFKVVKVDGEEVIEVEAEVVN